MSTSNENVSEITFQLIRDLWNEGETLAEAAARNYADSETHDADYSVEGGESATYEAFLVEAVLCVQHPNYLDQITPAQAAHLYEIGAVDLDSYNEWREVNDDSYRVWVKDSNGNRCSVEHFGSLEAAKAALDSLVNCKDCTNCVGCVGCTGCEECVDCIDCDYCKFLAGGASLCAI